jgi:hypothetical protein
MSITPPVIEFQFPGYGPDTGQGLALVSPEGHLVLTEAPNNPEVPLMRIFRPALERVLAALEPEGTPVRRVYVLLTENSVAPGTVWRYLPGPRPDAERSWSADKDLWAEAKGWDFENGLDRAVSMLNELRATGFYGSERWDDSADKPF